MSSPTNYAQPSHSIPISHLPRNTFKDTPTSQDQAYRVLLTPTPTFIHIITRSILNLLILLPSLSCRHSTKHLAPTIICSMSLVLRFVCQIPYRLRESVVQCFYYLQSHQRCRTSFLLPLMTGLTTMDNMTDTCNNTPWSFSFRTCRLSKYCIICPKTKLTSMHFSSMASLHVRDVLLFINLPYFMPDPPPTQLTRLCSYCHLVA